MRRLLLRVSLALLLPGAQGAAQNTPAQLWRGVEGTGRLLYVMGLIDGGILAHGNSIAFFADSSVRRVWLKQPPESSVPIDSAFASAMRNQVRANANAVEATMSRLYDDPANSCLRWWTVAWVAVEVLNGLDAARRDQILSSARRETAGSCTPR